MPVENAPISSFLRKIVRDPATTKLLTILFSTILIVVTTERTRKVWHMVCLLAIYSSALIYSIISLFVVTFDMQDKIGESTCLKKIFCGRKIYWHEIQACASFILAVTQLSTITLAFAGEINRPETHVVCD
uniref:Uncharacterized protein n=1 Tax=Panagrolaimus davidi TaxID=227884 RepID=A0A914Q4M1_9BILA